MKRKISRLLSAMLAMVLLISVLPADGMAADNGTLTLDFTKNASGELFGASGGTIALNLKGNGWELDSAKTPAFTAKYTLLNTIKKLDGYAMTIAINNQYNSQCAPWPFINASKGGEKSVLTFKIKLGENAKGYYKIRLKTANLNSAGTFYVYANDNYAGFLNNYGVGTASNITAWTETELTPVYLTADENGYVELKFAYAGPGRETGQAYGRLILNSITFTPMPSYEAPRDWQLVENIDDDNGSIVMYTGDTIDVTAYAAASDGTVFETNGYTSSRDVDGKNRFIVTLSGEAASLEDETAFGKYYTSVRTVGENETVSEYNTDFNGTYKGKLKAVSAGTATLTISANIGSENPITKTINIEVRGERVKEPVELEFSNKTISGNYVDKAYVPAQNWVYSADNWVPLTEKTSTNKYNSVKSTGVRLAMSPNWATAKDRNTAQFAAMLKNSIAPGYYNVKFTAPKHSTAGKMYIYVGGEYAGAYNSNEAGASDKAGQQVVLNTVYLSGRPEVVFALSDKPAGSGTNYGTFYKLNLDPAEVETLEYKEIGHDIPETIYRGESREIRIAAKLNDGSEMHYNGYTADAEEDTSDALSVSVEGEGVTLSGVVNDDGIITGTLSGVKTGEVTIKVTGKYNNKDFNEDIRVSAISPVLAGVELSAPKTALLIDDETELKIAGTTFDGFEIPVGSVTAVYESSDENVVKVDENGKVTAVAEGKATVSVIARDENENELRDSIEISVYKKFPSIVIDFSQTVTETSGTYPRPTITPGYTLLDGYAGNSYWARYSHADAGKDLLYAVTQGTGKTYWPDPKASNTAIFGISIDVPYDSYYSIKLDGGLFNNGGYHSAYIDEQYLGDHVFYMPGTEKGISSTTFNTVHLTEGKHNFYLKVRQKGDNDLPRVILNTLTLTPADGEIVLSHIDAGTVPEVMAVGEHFSGTAVAYMTDGTARHFGEFAGNGEEEKAKTISAECSDGLELTAFVDCKLGKTEKTEFKITAKAAVEKATFSIEAKLDEDVKTREFEIKIEDDPIKSAGAKLSAEELFAGDTAELVPVTELESGRLLPNNGSAVTVFTSENTEVATVDENGMLTARKAGNARIKVETTFNEVTKTGYFDVEILPESMTGIEVTAGGSKYIRLTDKGEADTAPLYVQAISNLGNKVDMSDARISAVSKTPEIATVDENLNIHPISEGKAIFAVTVNLAGRERTYEHTLTVVKGKSRSSFYTKEKVSAIRANIKKYDWLETTAEKAVDSAEFYVTNFEQIYDLIHSEGLPRIRATGVEADTDKNVCKYCGENLVAEYNTYPWIHDPLNRPWQIQCPDCKRLFPSNDFGGFYKLGLNEYGEFDHQRALDAHHRLVKHGSADAACTCTAPVAETQTDRTPEWYDYYGYGDENGFLYNKLYADDDPEDIAYFREGEKLETWGVDDGFGYIPRKEDGTPYLITVNETTTTPERHTYIGEYLFHGLWRNGASYDTTGAVVYRAFGALMNAYYYSGDVKYGRPLALLTDRIADFYADFDMTIYEFEPWRSSSSRQGKLLNHIWENGPAQRFAEAYDITYELYDDPYVLEWIKNKSKSLKFRDAKNTPSQIRTHIEDGVVRGGLEALTGEASYEKGKVNIGGNFGYPQLTNATLAVILDTMPETKEWLDYLMAPGWNEKSNARGGGVNERLITVVDHDGHGNEGSAYNNAWHTSLIEIADVLDGYDAYKAVDLYQNPKFVRMFYATVPLTSSYYSPQIGDSSSTLGKTFWMSETVAMRGWEKLGDPLFAQFLYLLNGNSYEGLHYDMTDSDPDRLADEVRNVIETYGTLELDSEMMTGFGFGILRDGADYTNASAQTAKDTRRDVWTYFGHNADHGHYDTLNLGMTAYGLNFMPDLGYPKEANYSANRLQWVDSTLSHNTVMVDKIQHGATDMRGKTLHFDGDGAVQLMDVADRNVYAKSTDEYRRSVVMIEVNDEISYTVDFFRVLGGNDHLYSFHASSDEIAEIKGLEFTPQVDPETGKYTGTYLGVNVPYEDPETGEQKIFNDLGADPYSPQKWNYTTVFPRGYTWVDTVDRDSAPEEKFEIDFKIKDFNKAIKDSSGLHLRMTMLDGKNRDGRDVSVSAVNGYPPDKAENKNIPFFRYIFVQHSAKDEDTALDTTFTTVFEPYRTNRYLKAIDELPMSPVSGTETESDAYRAVRVEHTSGRVDYVLYATNNKVTYEIAIDNDEKLSFSGFIGVYTVQNGKNTYKYLHDGTILGESTGVKGAIEGAVVSYTDDFVFENEIVIKPSSAVAEADLAQLQGRFVVIDNGAKARNAAYKIEKAELRGENLALDIGNVSLLRQYKNTNRPEDGFICNIEKDQTARIPLTYSEDSSPILTSVPEGVTVSAGSSVSAAVSASSPLEGVTLSYRADTLPRGASFDTEKGVLTWKPDKSQVGEHHVAITAVDNFGRETTAHFTVTVYGSTTGSTSSDKTDENGKTETPSTDSSAGGGGGGGGGAAPTPDTETAPDDTENTGETGANDGENAPDASGETESLRFTDLGNHVWAEDSINILAADGIIKGTTATTYSPANNITRADFALLLVRAFDLTSDNTENFADVSAIDYFAAELAVARNTGIVNGIGDNKYAPRNSITRQDMMVIVYRALQKLNVGFGIYDEPQYPDFDTVADYAKDAVSALIGAGLVNGKNGRIAPLEYTTRAEIAVLLKRVLEYIK